jgi:hypothetical protein
MFLIIRYKDKDKDKAVKMINDGKNIHDIIRVTGLSHKELSKFIILYYQLTKLLNC